MYKILLWALIGSLTSAFASFDTVTVLDRGEPFEAQVFQDHYLFVGKSRTNSGPDYRVEIYSADQKLVTTIKLTHSAAYIHPYSENVVLVSGTATTPLNQTAYTLIENLGGGKFRAAAHPIPETAWAYRWLGTINHQEYFADPGGNSADTNQDLDLPAQTIFTMDLLTNYLPVRLRLPIGGVANNRKLFVVQHEAIGDPRSNIGIIDTDSNQLTYLFPEFHNDLRDIVKMSENQLLASESGANKLWTIDPVSGKTSGEIQTEKGPWSLSASHHCAAVGNQADRSIQIFDLSDPSNIKTVGTFKIDLPETTFRLLTKVSLDVEDSTLYARSNYACNVMVEDCTQDWNRVVALKLSPNLLDKCRE